MLAPLAVLFLVVGITGSSVNVIKGSPQDEGLKQDRTVEIVPASTASRSNVFASSD